MLLDDILSRRLIIVSGKGGVGKTTVAATLGLLAAEAGKKTLIAEINAAERMADLFKTPPIGYKETRLSEKLFAINIDPRSAFEEYILEQIHSSKLFHLVFENRFVRKFLDATPGLNELLEIGKIWALTERDLDESGERPKYDLVIVDAPATGHGLAFLNVARVVVEAVRVGPLKNKAEQIMRLIQDPKKTLLILTTLAEEMPVNETLEMMESARSKVKIACGPVIANALFPSIFEDKEWKNLSQKIARAEDPEIQKPLCLVTDLYRKRVLLERFYLNKLKMNLDARAHLLLLPFLFKTEFNVNALEELATHLEEACLASTPIRKHRRKQP